MEKAVKMYLLSLLALASCAKEAPESAYKMIDVTFSVFTDGVKSSLDDHAVVWTNDVDQVAIYDDIQGFLNTPFTVSGNSVSASVTQGAANFYSIYPYNASSSISGSVISSTLPAVQEATDGSFDPAANLSIAYTTVSDMSLYYKNVGALVQFTLNEDDVKSITLMGNNNEKIAGKVSIDYNGGSPLATASEISVTMNHADGSVISKGGTYYFVVAPVTFSRGITFVLTKTDGTFAIRSTKSSVAFDRNQFVKLGNISGLSFDNDLYAAFTAGATIEIAGIGYNKADFSGANQILALDSDITPDIRPSVSGKKAIVFLSGSADFTYTAALTLSQELVLVNRYPNTTITLKPTRYSVFRGGSLVMKGIVFDGTSITDKYAFNNADATSSFNKFHFDDCHLILSKNLFAISLTSYGISSLRFVHSNIKTTATVTLVNAGTSPGMDIYQDIVFENNVVYSPSLNTFQVINYANATEQTNAGNSAAWTGSVSILNNVFYNFQSANGLFRHFQVSSFIIGGNIYYSPITSGTSKTYYLFSEAQDKGVIKNTGDVIYGLDGGSWVYSGNGYGQPAGVANALSNEPENPFDSFNTTTDAYTLKAAYKAYGPQND
ncbi:MAG: hypothetical protein IKR38_04265 [Bacteroidales bacterium]|nr:hypothetical protein [Bacteroidales bacterium]